MTTIEQRKHLRYETDVKVKFYVPYDFKTEVDFSLAEKITAEKYIGYSKNISVFGLCIESNKELKVGDHLWLELHMPDSPEIVYMQGITRWVQLSVVTPESPKMFLLGIEVDVVDGVDVEKTVYYDQKYGVFWSELLERILGSFAQLHKKKPTQVVLRGILKDNTGCYLMVKRSHESKTWPSKWEFPGGKVEPGEHTTSALKREFHEEVALEVAPLQRFMDFTYERPQGNVEYKIFLVEKVSGEVAISAEHDEFGWFSIEEMMKLDVSPPLVDVIERLGALPA
ncbi:MAG: NUDIX domain-containing protein [Candidatus Omnitrophica bacterium]|nr:NUDIX domain-containing protein [Candidatus Omnitrophota bacterium]